MFLIVIYAGFSHVHNCIYTCTWKSARFRESELIMQYTNTRGQKSSIDDTLLFRVLQPKKRTMEKLSSLELALWIENYKIEWCELSPPEAAIGLSGINEIFIQKRDWKTSIN